MPENATIPETMRAFTLTGFGDFDKLRYVEDYPTPRPQADELLLKVEACGVNNTDIWTREGAYGGALGTFSQSGWRGGTFHFPRIQGADIVGEVVALGGGVPEHLLHKRIIVNPTLYDNTSDVPLHNAGIIGSERDGGFADYAAGTAATAIPVDSSLSSPELAT